MHFEPFRTHSNAACAHTHTAAKCTRLVWWQLNAAKNIAVNGMLLLAGRSPIAVHTPEEVELVQLENDMLGA